MSNNVKYLPYLLKYPATTGFHNKRNVRIEYNGNKTISISRMEFILIMTVHILVFLRTAYCASALFIGK